MPLAAALERSRETETSHPYEPTTSSNACRSVMYGCKMGTPRSYVTAEPAEAAGHPTLCSRRVAWARLLVQQDCERIAQLVVGARSRPVHAQCPQASPRMLVRPLVFFVCFYMPVLETCQWS